MIAFIEELDNWFASYIEAKYPDEVSFLKSFGYVEITNRKTTTQNQPIPVTINGTSDREQVSLDDRFQVMSWFRLPGQMTLANDVEGNNWSFGFQSNPVQKVGLRWVIGHRVELGEEFIFDLIEALPYKLSVTGHTIASIDRSSLTLDADHESVYKTELGETVYESHRFTWNIYALSVNLSYIINPNCPVGSGCCDNSYVSITE
jgi:hypothetical protein